MSHGQQQTPRETEVEKFITGLEEVSTVPQGATWGVEGRVQTGDTDRIWGICLY